MQRRHGRALRGQRACAAVPNGHWKTSTFVIGPHMDGSVAPFVLDGAMTDAIFHRCVAGRPAPTLPTALRIRTAAAKRV